jgi:uncharacterized membrane protein YfcA
MFLLGYILSFFIGIILGLIGGGGAILMIPLLDYFFGIPMDEGTSYSLFVIGLGALVGTIQRFKFLPVYWKPAILFILPSAIVAMLIRLFIVPYIPDAVDIGFMKVDKQLFFNALFILLMFYIGIQMLRNKPETKENKEFTFRLVFPYALLTGLLAGFLGAGGGFIIVPILMKMGMPMKKAIGISLLIVFIQSMLAFTGDLIHQFYTNEFYLNYSLLFVISGLAIAGTLLGSFLQKWVPTKTLKVIFGLILLIVASGIFIDRFLI